MGKQQRHILFVDAFDSFTNNIVGLLERTLNADVTVIHINHEGASEQLKTVLSVFDAVVVGPGPGHPSNPHDVGFINRLWALEDAHTIPILAICLGFQSLGLAYGAAVTRLCKPRHGIITEVSHDDKDIFVNTGSFHATNYHSLKVELTDFSRLALAPLAWDYGDEVNGPVLMAMKHVSKPFWGVQFHPESICTTKDAAERLLANWWRSAESWLSSKDRTIAKDRINAMSILSPTISEPVTREEQSPSSIHLSNELRLMLDGYTPKLHWTKRTVENVSPIQLCECLDISGEETVLLDSQGSARGRFSILGLIHPDHTIRYTYTVGERELRFGIGSNPDLYSTRNLESIDHVWIMLQEVLDAYKLEHPSGPADSPFWGGFMGYFSYKAGLDTMSIPIYESSTTSRVPDVNLVFVHQSIVIDHQSSCVYVQSLLPGDSDRVEEMGNKIELACKTREIAIESINTALEKALKMSEISKPPEPGYCAKVSTCQEELAIGNSYELCLTDETKISAPPSLNPLQLYKKLRRTNPAPFGAFLQLSNVTVVGSSPERFLHWDRHGHIEFRPIKGTVKKSPEMSREEAHSILNSSKERAENLMIVDLIRHDLSGVVGAHNTWVSQLMVMEEYETVYQLVSAIEGQLPTKVTGIDVLRASLPPGSMTGAPKRRSCEILRDLEKRSRGVYSGVLGYMDIGGGADFSVVIRTAINTGCDEIWRVGAGGAITIQSDAKAEFQEMEVKASSVLGAINPSTDETEI